MADERREAAVEDAFVAWLARNRRLWAAFGGPDSEDLRVAFAAGWAAALGVREGEEGDGA